MNQKKTRKIQITNRRTFFPSIEGDLGVSTSGLTLKLSVLSSLLTSSLFSRERGGRVKSRGGRMVEEGGGEQVGEAGVAVTGAGEGGGGAR